MIPEYILNYPLLVLFFFSGGLRFGSAIASDSPQIASNPHKVDKVDGSQEFNLLNTSSSEQHIRSRINSAVHESQQEVIDAAHVQRSSSRREQSKDLKRLIQELEESDYSNYGSWGNFRTRPPLSAGQHGHSNDMSNGDRMNSHQGGYDYFEVREHDDIDEDIGGVGDDDGNSRIWDQDDEDDGGRPGRGHASSVNRGSMREVSDGDDGYGYFYNRRDADYFDIRRGRGGGGGGEQAERRQSSSSLNTNDVSSSGSSSSSAGHNRASPMLSVMPAMQEDFSHPYQQQQYPQQYQQQSQPQNRLQLAPESFYPTSTAPFPWATPVGAGTIREQVLSELSPDRALKFTSVIKIAGIVGLLLVLSYSSVAPRTLPAAEYNRAYKDSIARVFCSFIWPILLLSWVYRSQDSNINEIVSKFTFAFTIGYVTITATEGIIVTLVRLLILRVLEPAAFKYCPKIPALFLPWKLSQIPYFPRQITLMVLALVSSCVVAPLIEEWGKLILFQLGQKLWNNMKSISNNSKNNSKNNRKKVNQMKKNDSKASSEAKSGTGTDSDFDSVAGTAGANDLNDSYSDSYTSGRSQVTAASARPVSVRSYVTNMLATSLGIKLADSMRRILLYTHSHQNHKMFFAIMRGIFPVQELAGALTALALARRHFLSAPQFELKKSGHERGNNNIIMRRSRSTDRLSLFATLRLLWPAVLLHTAANLRGMKALYVWASHRPWDEVQLQAWNALDEASPRQILITSVFNFMWFMVLAKTLLSVLSEYMAISREVLLRGNTINTGHSANLGATGVGAGVGFDVHTGMSGTPLTGAMSQMFPPGTGEYPQVYHQQDPQQIHISDRYPPNSDYEMMSGSQDGYGYGDGDGDDYSYSGSNTYGGYSQNRENNKRGNSRNRGANNGIDNRGYSYSSDSYPGQRNNNNNAYPPMRQSPQPPPPSFPSPSSSSSSSSSQPLLPPSQQQQQQEQQIQRGRNQGDNRNNYSNSGRDPYDSDSTDTGTGSDDGAEWWSKEWGWSGPRYVRTGRTNTPRGRNPHGQGSGGGSSRGSGGRRRQRPGAHSR